MDGRGVRLLAASSISRGTAATVRVRNGETLVTDGPFAETKEFIAGFEVLECADSRGDRRGGQAPVVLVQTIEVRPFMAGSAGDEQGVGVRGGEDGGAASRGLRRTATGGKSAAAGG